MQYADIVVPRGSENTVAMQLIVHHVKDQLKQVHTIYFHLLQCNQNVLRYTQYPT